MAALAGCGWCDTFARLLALCCMNAATQLRPSPKLASGFCFNPVALPTCAVPNRGVPPASFSCTVERQQTTHVILRKHDKRPVRWLVFRGLSIIKHRLLDFYAVWFHTWLVDNRGLTECLFLSGAGEKSRFVRMFVFDWRHCTTAQIAKPYNHEGWVLRRPHLAHNSMPTTHKGRVAACRVGLSCH